MERLPLSHLFRSDVWLARGQSIPLLDDLNGKVLWFPLRHRVRALIFVCQQWHAISCRGTGAKTQVLILSTLMGLMAGKMRETACHWKCNALCWVTSCAGAGSTTAMAFRRERRSVSNSGQEVVTVGILFGCRNTSCSLALKNTKKLQPWLWKDTAPKWCFYFLSLIICFTDCCKSNVMARCSSALSYKPFVNCHEQFAPKNTSQRYIALSFTLMDSCEANRGEAKSSHASCPAFVYFPNISWVHRSASLMCMSENIKGTNRLFKWQWKMAPKALCTSTALHRSHKYLYNPLEPSFCFTEVELKKKKFLQNLLWGSTSFHSRKKNTPWSLDFNIQLTDIQC